MPKEAVSQCSVGNLTLDKCLKLKYLLGKSWNCTANISPMGVNTKQRFMKNISFWSSQPSNKTHENATGVKSYIHRTTHGSWDVGSKSSVKIKCSFVKELKTKQNPLRFHMFKRLTS